MSSLPRRNPRSLRSFSLHVSAVLVLAVSSLGLAGCPGELDPRLLGPTGTGGTGGPQVCDGKALMRGQACSQPGCHAASGAQAGLDLFSDGVVQRLLGKSPIEPPPAGAACAGMNMPYLVAGSNPATGLLLDKLKNPAPCGLPMPYPGLMLLPAAEIACLQEWSTAVTTGMITQ